MVELEKIEQRFLLYIDRRQSKVFLKRFNAEFFRLLLRKNTEIDVKTLIVKLAIRNDGKFLF